MTLYVLAFALSVLLKASAQPSPAVQAAIVASLKTQAAAQANGSTVDWTTHVVFLAQKSVIKNLFDMMICQVRQSIHWDRQ